MPNKHPRMKWSPDEELFLRHWMYEEFHFREGQRPAKRLQVQNRAVPADLAVLIAAVLPDPIDQEAAGIGPPPSQPPTWPWPGESLRRRLVEAQEALGQTTAHDGLAGEPSTAPQATPLGR